MKTCRFLMLILLATLFSMTAAAQKIDCSGTIVDTNGEPIIGASVFLKGETKGAVSDLNGVFKLQQVPEGSMITVSYIGYKTVETKAEADMRIVMHEDNELLNEVVVVGYGVQKKSVNSQGFGRRPGCHGTRAHGQRPEGTRCRRYRNIVFRSAGSRSADTCARYRYYQQL